MVSGGNATIIVSNFDRSIKFYTEALGLKLTNRFGNDWATVSAGEGLTIGIHPTSAQYPAPGTKGAIILGLDISMPVDRAVSRLAQHGVTIKGSIVRSGPGNFAHLEDPDGNEIYLWEKVRQTAPEPELVHASVS
jgi:predicted enzyme related to lactoylglutathione lyase